MITIEQQKWYHLADRLRFKLCLAWCLEKMALPLVVLTLVATLIILIMRYYMTDYQFWIGVSILSLAVLVSIVIGFLLAKKHFEKRAEVLIRLESALNLNSTLSAAEQGRSSWPRIEESSRDILRWNMSRLYMPIIGSILLMAASLLIPMAEHQPELDVAAPSSWEEMLTKLNELEETELIEPKYIDEIEEKIKELQSQPQEDWYKHASLEASEQIKRTHQLELETLNNNLNRMNKSLTLLEEHGEELSNIRKKNLQETLNQAMKSMENSRLKPNKELLKKMGEAANRKLTPEEAKKMREKLNNMSEATRKQLRDGLDPGDQLPDNSTGGQRERARDPNAEP